MDTHYKIMLRRNGLNTNRINTFLALGALVIAIVALVFSLTGAGLPGGASLTGAAGARDPAAAGTIRLTCESKITGFFQVADGPGSITDVVTQRVVDDRGHELDLPIPGKTRNQELVLQRSLTSDTSAWDWRSSVVQNGADRSRVGCELQFLDPKMAIITKFSLTNAWPSEYSVTNLLKDGSQGTLTETLTVVYDFMARLK